MKLRSATEKYVLREAMRPYLPEPLYQRKKQYFRAPPVVSGKNSRLYQLVQDELSGNAVKDIPFLDSKKTRALSDRLAQRTEKEQSALDYVLMEITGLCFLQRKFLMGTAI